MESRFKACQSVSTTADTLSPLGNSRAADLDLTRVAGMELLDWNTVVRPTQGTDRVGDSFASPTGFCEPWVCACDCDAHRIDAERLRSKNW